MLRDEWERLKRKYGHSKCLLAMHFLGKCVKNLYHIPKFRKKITICGKDNFCPYVPEGLAVEIIGDGNTVEIDPSIQTYNGRLSIGDWDSPANGCCVHIGKGCTSNGVKIVLLEDKSRLTIGDDCMFSWDVDIYLSDFHSIYLSHSKEIINKGKELIIGNHVWIGMNATVLKNSLIPDHSIVGAHSVVAGKFEETNCVLAGNPAKVVKRAIDWSRSYPNLYQTEK